MNKFDAKFVSYQSDDRVAEILKMYWLAFWVESGLPPDSFKKTRVIFWSGRRMAVGLDRVGPVLHVMHGHKKAFGAMCATFANPDNECKHKIPS